MWEPLDERTLLIAFVDLARYARISDTRSNYAMFAIVAEYAELVGSNVAGAGGRVIKFIGDEALISFEESQVREGVAALKSLKATVDAWLESHELDSELLVRAHVGMVATGQIGTANDKRFDIIGRAVNETAMMTRGPFVLSPRLKHLIAIANT